MFVCQNCSRQTQRGEKAHRRPTIYRDKVYPYRAEANCWHEPSKTFPADPGGKGREVEMEITICTSCSEDFKPRMMRQAAAAPTSIRHRG